MTEADASHIHALAGRLIRPADVVVDIGPGIRPQSFLKAACEILVEPYYEYAIRLRQDAGRSRVILEQKALHFFMQQADRSVDTVFFLDSLEHISRTEGGWCLSGAQRIARQQVVVFTPLGFMAQELRDDLLDEWGMHGGYWQVHRSGWNPEDFPGWQIVIARAFHPNNGAFYAIWNRN